LTILAGWAHGVGVAGACADTSGDVANALSRVFTSIVDAVVVGVAGYAKSSIHAVVTLGLDAVRIGVARIDTKTRGEVAVRLARVFTSIEISTSARGSTADTVLRLLTIVTARAGARQAIVVAVASEWGDANTKTGITSGLVRGRTSIEITAVDIASAS